MRCRLIFKLTTPPTPKAGMMRHMRAAVLTSQFDRTTSQRSRKVPPGRLYMSRPSRCIGVEKSCTEAGAMNCAVVKPETCRRNLSDNFESTQGANKGGRLKDAKIVKQSRIVKRI